MHYQIRYVDFDATLKTRVVEAQSEAAALEAVSHIPRQRIRGISLDRFAAIKKELTKEKMSLPDQASFLASYTAALAGGADQGEAFDRLAGQRKKYEKLMPEIRAASRPSEKMQIMNFDEQVVLLSQVGETSGNLSEMVRQAADDIIQRNSIIADATKRLTMPAMLAMLGTAMIIALPLYSAETISDLIEMPNLEMDTVFLTDMIIYLDWFYRNAWMFGVAGLIGAAVAIKKFWRNLENLPGFRAFTNVSRDRRSVIFLLSYPALFEAGIRPEQAIEKLQNNSGGRSKEVYGKMLKRLRKGDSLSETFDRNEWSPLLVDAMGGVDNITPVQARGYFGQVQPLAVTALNKSVGKLVGVVAILGFAVAFTALLMTIGGTLFPIMSAQPSSMG